MSGSFEYRIVDGSSSSSSSSSKSWANPYFATYYQSRVGDSDSDESGGDHFESPNSWPEDEGGGGGVKEIHYVLEAPSIHSGSGSGHGHHYPPECCPLVVDPLAFASLLASIVGGTVFLNTAITMNIGRKRRRRRRRKRKRRKRSSYSDDEMEDLVELLLQAGEEKKKFQRNFEKRRCFHCKIMFAVCGFPLRESSSWNSTANGIREFYDLTVASSPPPSSPWKEGRERHADPGGNPVSERGEGQHSHSQDRNPFFSYAHCRNRQQSCLQF